MTKMSFDVSAAFPGYTAQQPWDFDWKGAVLNPQLVSVVVAENKGVETTLDMTHTVATGIVDLPVFHAPGRYGRTFIFLGPAGTPVSVDARSFVGGGGTAGRAYTEQSIAVASGWDSVKNVRISGISARVLDVSGFVDTWVDAAGDNADRAIDIDSAKRGLVSLGNGNDTIRIGVAADEYTWSSHFVIEAGNGNDVVDVKPEAYSVVKGLVSPSGGVFNATPQLTTADIRVGNGNNAVSMAEMSGTIHVGDGNDTIDITDGNTEIWLGRGNDVVMIGAPVGGASPAHAYDTQTGSSIVHVGSGHVDVTIDDTVAAQTPRTTLDFIHRGTGGSTVKTADAVRYGHYDSASSSFVGGDLGAVTIDLAGYSAGSTVTLAPPMAAGGAMLLQIHDAATHGVDALALYGATVLSAASLDVRFT